MHLPTKTPQGRAFGEPRRFSAVAILRTYTPILNLTAGGGAGRYLPYCLVLSLAMCGAQSAGGQTTSAAPDDWARLAPGSARLYVEVRDLAGVRAILRRHGVWETVRSLGDEPAGAVASTTQPWHRRAHATLNLSPEQAITELLGRRAALVAREPGQWRSGIILAELSDATALRSLLRRWQARPLEGGGPIQRFTLPGQLRLAVRGELIVLGPASEERGLFGETAELLAGKLGANLATRSDFSALRSELVEGGSGLFYAAWPEGGGEEPRWNRLLVGVGVDEHGARCDVRGHRAERIAVEPSVVPFDAADLPPSTIGCWVGSFDFARLSADGAPAGQDENETLWGVLLAAAAETGPASATVIDLLGPRYQVILGRRDAEGAFALPELTVLLETREGGKLATHLDGLLGLLAQLAEMMATSRPEEVDARPITTRRRQGIEIRRIDVGALLSKRVRCPFLARLEFSWATFDGKLGLSSSASHLEQIVRSARRERPGSQDAQASTAPAGGNPLTEPCVEWLHVRGRDIADMLDGWLAFLRAKDPQVLSATWWRAWARRQLDRRMKLGLALRADPDHPRRALVTEVAHGTVAAAYVWPGDRIVGVQGRPLATTHPAREVAEQYAGRGNAREFVLEVLRGEELLTLRLPVYPVDGPDLSGFDPIAAIRRIADVARPLRTLTVWRYASAPDRLRARVELEWEDPERSGATPPMRR